MRVIFALLLCHWCTACSALLSRGPAAPPATVRPPAQRPAHAQPEGEVVRKNPKAWDQAPQLYQQGRSRSDAELTAGIRRAVLEDERTSFYAHNIKIISQEGKVTLRGAVKSDQERRVVEEIAARAAGPENVTSALRVLG